MRPLLIAGALLLTGCSTEPSKQPIQQQAESPEPPKPKQTAPMPADETRLFPPANRVDAKVVNEPLLNRSFLPAGNLADYKRGKKTWQLFLIRTASSESASLLLFDIKKNLDGSKFVPHFGGYSGTSGKDPFFIFAKTTWVAGVVGLPEPEADKLARDFAARIR